jgi:transcriptional regulator with XRE-family HTH domain
LLLPEPEKASLGVRLRYLRRKAGLSLDGLAEKSGLQRNLLSRLERNKGREANLPWVLGRILPFLAGRFKDAFPEAKGDPYDFLIPPTTFGGWLKNFRMRRGLKLIDLARAVKVRPFTIIRYEADESKPNPEVRGNLRRAYRLNGELDRFF